MLPNGFWTLFFVLITAMWCFFVCLFFWNEANG